MSLPKKIVVNGLAPPVGHVACAEGCYARAVERQSLLADATSQHLSSLSAARGHDLDSDLESPTLQKKRLLLRSVLRGTGLKVIDNKWRGI